MEAGGDAEDVHRAGKVKNQNDRFAHGETSMA